jgi:hypothetical protein
LTARAHLRAHAVRLSNPVALAWQDYWKIRTLDLMAGGMSVRFPANPPVLGKPFTFTVT